MTPFQLAMRHYVNKFAVIGRKSDFLLGVVTLGLAVYWRSPWLAAFGALSLFCFAIDLNGRFQRWSQAKAMGVAQRRQAKMQAVRDAARGIR